GLAPISDSSGNVGGSIYAGSIYSANNLEVAGNTQLWNGLSINGAVSILGATSTVPSPLFNVATSSSSSVFSILSNGNVGIGTTTPTVALSVNGVINQSPLAIPGTSN